MSMAHIDKAHGEKNCQRQSCLQQSETATSEREKNSASALFPTRTLHAALVIMLVVKKGN